MNEKITTKWGPAASKYEIDVADRYRAELSTDGKSVQITIQPSRWGVRDGVLQSSGYFTGKLDGRDVFEYDHARGVCAINDKLDSERRFLQEVGGWTAG